MRTIAVVNQKGGCGKTITAINLSGFLARERRRVLVVDLDPQGHATLGLAKGPDPPSRTLYEVFTRRADLGEVAQPAFVNLDVAPADILLSAASEQLAAIPGRENILADAIDRVRDRYDYIVVDCPPNVGLLTFNAMKACTEAVVPMDPSFFSLHGIAKLLETFEVLREQTGHRITARVLVTLYSGRSKFVRDVVDDVRAHLAGRLYQTIIRHSVKLAEAASHGVPITEYSRHCAGFDDYQALASEVVQAEPQYPSAPRLTPEGVVFTIEAPEAASVQLAGDFNAWVPEGGEMSRNGCVWRKVLKLEPGRYCYRYVVDGCWRSDPLNAEVESSPYGGHNSVLVLGG